MPGRGHRWAKLEAPAAGRDLPRRRAPGPAGGELSETVDARVRIPMRPDGPDSLNVAMAATVALYELGHRMAAHA